VKAIITVIRETTYSSIVEMDEEKFDRLNDQLDGELEEMRSAEKELNSLIDVSDWQDDDLKRVDEFKRFEEEPK
jgi:hypothetical protein